MTFGDRLREARRSAGLRQEELADRAEVSRATLSRLENDEIRHPWISTVLRLAGVLGRTVEELYGKKL